MKWNKELLKRFINGEVVINVRTEQECDDFIKKLDVKGYQFLSNTLFKERKHWHEYAENTCIRCCGFILKYESDTCYRNMGYEIIPYSQLIKQDLRDLLKEGYIYVCDSSFEPFILDLDSYLEDIDNELKLKQSGFQVDRIYRPKYNGIKPMEWELIWERTEPKFYLRSWVDCGGELLALIDSSGLNYLNLRNKDKELVLNNKYYNIEYQTQFTQAEIDNLPNQEFIRTLVKQEVPNE